MDRVFTWVCSRLRPSVSGERLRINLDFDKDKLKVCQWEHFAFRAVKFVGWNARMVNVHPLMLNHLINRLNLWVQWARNCCLQEIHPVKYSHSHIFTLNDGHEQMWLDIFDCTGFHIWRPKLWKIDMDHTWVNLLYVLYRSVLNTLFHILRKVK